MKLDRTKVQKTLASLDLNDLSGYELFALTGMLKSLAETAIYDEIADKTLDNQLLSSIGTETKN